MTNTCSSQSSASTSTINPTPSLTKKAPRRNGELFLILSYLKNVTIMNTKKNLIRLMLAGIFILTVCFYFSIDDYHEDLPFDSISDEVLEIPFDVFDHT